MCFYTNLESSEPSLKCHYTLVVGLSSNMFHTIIARTITSLHNRFIVGMDLITTKFDYIYHVIEKNHIHNKVRVVFMRLINLVSLIYNTN